MAVNLSALKSELQTDPSNLGFSNVILAGDYNRLADLLNSVSATHSTVTVGTVNALTMQQCVVVGEYNLLTAQQRDLWNAIITTATTGISISNTTLRAQIAGIWSAGTSTRANLTSLQTRICTRVEALFGEGERADANIIYVALRNT